MSLTPLFQCDFDWSKKFILFDKKVVANLLCAENCYTQRERGGGKSQNVKKFGGRNNW
jgi:hypothetical protein